MDINKTAYFIVKFNLTRGASLLYDWLRLKDFSGKLIQINLKDFQSLSQRCCVRGGYDIKHIKNCMNELENIGLIKLVDGYNWIKVYCPQRVVEIRSGICVENLKLIF